MFSSNPAELRTRQFWENRKNSKNLSRHSKKIWKIRALEKSQILSFFALRNVRVLFENQRKSEKWWGKRWEFKKRIREQFRKTVKNECFGKISEFLINVPKPIEYLRKFLKKFLRNSEKYFYQGGRVNASRSSACTRCLCYSMSASSPHQISRRLNVNWSLENF